MIWNKYFFRNTRQSSKCYYTDRDTYLKLIVLQKKKRILFPFCDKLSKVNRKQTPKITRSAIFDYHSLFFSQKPFCSKIQKIPHNAETIKSNKQTDELFN